MYTVSKKRPPVYILNNSAKNEPILLIFGVQNRVEISHQKIINNVATLPREKKQQQISRCLTTHTTHQPALVRATPLITGRRLL